MDEVLECELHRVTRSGGPLAVAMLDMDRFKSYNDTFGHPSGDLLLQRAFRSANRLRSGVPGGQTCSIGVAAWDGQEDVPGLVARADAALYEAKHAGRDRTVLADVRARHRPS